MKLLLSSIAATALATLSSQAAAVFWSFQTTGNNPAASAPVTFVDGLGTNPSIARFNGTGGSTNAAASSGGATYTYNGQTYVGSGGSGAGTNGSGGFSMVWSTPTDPLGRNYFNGAGFTVTSLSTVGLTDLSVRFDVRAATANVASGRPSNSFSAIEYSLNGGTTWLNTGVTSPTWANGTGTASTGFEAVTIDLSSVDALEGQSNLQLRFTFVNSGVPTADVNQNIRVDNLLITAIPEPSAVALLGLGSLMLCVSRRRK